MSGVILYIENKKLHEKIEEKQIEFELISPSIAWMDAEDFLDKQKNYQLQYGSLKESMLNILNESAKGKYGIYYEDLNTGAWVGINEREKYLPMSLFKVPLMISVLKKIEDGQYSLDQEVILTPADLDSKSGEFYKKNAGYKTTIRELIEIMIKDSDNTAMMALSNRFLDDEDYLKALSIMGLPVTTEGSTKVSPKEYSNVFRALYFSNYLRRPFSELALTILLDTHFNSQIPAGISDKSIKVSHKIGFDYKENYFHDCGIVYLPEKNYLLCIMAKNTTKENADLVMSRISETVFEYRNPQTKE